MKVETTWSLIAVTQTNLRIQPVSGDAVAPERFMLMSCTLY